MSVCIDRRIYLDRLQVYSNYCLLGVVHWIRASGPGMSICLAAELPSDSEDRLEGALHPTIIIRAKVHYCFLMINGASEDSDAAYP